MHSQDVLTSFREILDQLRPEDLNELRPKFIALSTGPAEAAWIAREIEHEIQSRQERAGFKRSNP